ncbi:MAG: hypothetical protein HQL52_14655 [Magnetococcales bacterium]|nr:hypothetical protein [Magnetococcales bacterium]
MKSYSKADVVRLLLENEGRVMLYLNATRSGVEVPRRLMNDQGLRLILNRKMPHPIHVTATGVESELRFGGVPHYCIIPYSALWGALNPDTGHGMYWPDSMPEPIRRNYEFSRSLQAQHGADRPDRAASQESGEPMPQAKPAGASAKATPKAAKPVFQVIDGEGKSPDNGDTPPPARPLPPPPQAGEIVAC